MTEFINRQSNSNAVAHLTAHGIHPVLARCFAARNIVSHNELELELKNLLRPHTIKYIDDAAKLLTQTIRDQKKILVIADYDCDGATACAVAVRGLKLLGGNVDFLVPNRFQHGYGFAPEIVNLAKKFKPNLIVTVDNGIASIDGVNAANQAGIDVLITDHHLPGPILPAAKVIINPNQKGCLFASKCLAGVGVVFYVMLACRAELKKYGTGELKNQPKFSSLLDLVALGTIADVVPLDYNNRILVHQGLLRIKQGHMQPGVAALFQVSGRHARQATAGDLGFLLGPRLNAAGRLDDMSLGIKCLTTDDFDEALFLAQQLNALNQERRTIEEEMQIDALDDMFNRSSNQKTITIFKHSWHQGVIGIVASRLKDQFHCPTFTFAPDQEKENLLKGSGRSIPGFHLRDALDLMSKRHSNLFLSFGGHAMAAGATIHRDFLPLFIQAFEEIANEKLDEFLLKKNIMVDGPLDNHHFTIELAMLLEQQVWGQAFQAPLFSQKFKVLSQRLLQDKHLKLKLSHQKNELEAIWFKRTEMIPDESYLAYRLACNHFNGKQSLQLIIEHLKE